MRTINRSGRLLPKLLPDENLRGRNHGSNLSSGCGGTPDGQAKACVVWFRQHDGLRPTPSFEYKKESVFLTWYNIHIADYEKSCAETFHLRVKLGILQTPYLRKRVAGQAFGYNWRHWATAMLMLTPPQYPILLEYNPRALAHLRTHRTTARKV